MAITNDSQTVPYFSIFGGHKIQFQSVVFALSLPKQIELTHTPLTHINMRDFARGVCLASLY